MNCIDLTSKRSKMLSYVQTIPNTAKLQKCIKNDQKCWVTYQTIPNTAKLQKCIDLTSKRSKMLSYVPNHSKHSKTTKVIKSRWIASIWRQNDQKCWVTSQTIPNTAKQKCSNHDELQRFDVKTIKNFQLRSNQSKHSKTKVIKLRWIASIWRQNDKKCWVTSQTIPNTAKQKCSNHDELQRYDVKTIKNFQLRSNHSKHSKTKVIKLRWIASIWRQNDKKCWVTSQTIRNTAKLQKWSNYDELHRLDVQTIKNVELRPKPFQTQQN